jgi:hypothetical protein
MFFSPIISFLEAFTMDILGKEKKSPCLGIHQFYRVCACIG